MLAKEIKIRNLKQQREFIRRMLELHKSIPEIDGNTAYCYEGELFPEVIEYFEKEGFTIRQFFSADGEWEAVSDEGFPMYLFTIDDEIELSEEEMKQAEDMEIIDIDFPESCVDDFD